MADFKINPNKDSVSEMMTSIEGEINIKADLESPALTGTPTAPTAEDGTETDQVATTAFVKNTIAKSGIGEGINTSIVYNVKW